MESPKSLGLPYDSWRTGQRLAIRTALTSKTQHTIIQAPTGAGKSGIAVGIGRLGHGRSLTLTATNGLLHQYEQIAPDLAPIKGMRNYPCLAATGELKKYFRLVRNTHTITCDDGPCLSEVRCSLKEDGCHYFDAKRAAGSSQHPLSNYAYFFTAGVGPIDRLILDEAHALPEELMAAYRIEIPRYRLNGVVPKTLEVWREWGIRTHAEVQRQGEDSRVKQKRLLESCLALGKMNEDWAWEIQDEQLVFEPTVPRNLVGRLVSGDQLRLVYLSATVTPANLAILGVRSEDITFQEMPSRFPLAQRPIYVYKTGVRADFRMSVVEQQWLIHEMDEIIGARLDRKGLIHSVSYKRQQTLARLSKYGSIMWCPRNMRELMEMLPKFKVAPAPAILVSPSITTGFDFPYTAAEYQIIPKVPFPDTQSPIMKARIAATDDYRDDLTMRTIVQTCGRIVRAADDHGETFILDDHAQWFLRKHEHRAPQWFRDALVWVRRLPAPSPSLSERA